MKLKWYWYAAIIIFFGLAVVVVREVEARARAVKFRNYGPESREIPFVLESGESIIQPVHRVGLGGPEDGIVERLWFKVKFDDSSKGAYIVYATLDRGEHILVEAKFEVGKNPFYTIPGSGKENWNTYFVRISNGGRIPARGTITLVGDRRTVYDPTTGIERPVNFR